MSRSIRWASEEMTESKKQKNNLLPVIMIFAELLYEEDYLGRQMIRMGVQGREERGISKRR